MHRKMEVVQKHKNSHFDYENRESLIRYGIYPSSKSSKDFGSKSNFIGAAKKSNLKDEHRYDGEKLVIKERDCRSKS